jgi:hypothetical protein
MAYFMAYLWLTLWLTFGKSKPWLTYEKVSHESKPCQSKPWLTFFAMAYFSESKP